MYRRGLLMVLALAGIATFGAGSASAQDKTIKIGGLFPMSGPGAYFGAQDKQGIELALEELNKTGVNGYKFAIQYEDSACSPLPASQAAKRLLDQYKPDVIIGEECSDATLAIMPIIAEAKVPMINAGSSSIRITDPGNPYTFRIMPNEVMQGVDIATQAYNKLNARTAVLLYENTNAGIGNAKVFKDTFEKLGGKIVADIGFGRDVNDFTAIATRVAGAGKADVDPDLHAGRPGPEDHAGALAGRRRQGRRRPLDPARHHLAALRLRAEGRQGGGRLCAHRAVRPDRPARHGQELRQELQSEVQRRPDAHQCPCL